jgi:hypothetical protein
MITSNLFFYKRDQTVKDPMTTAAAIDPLVHHSVVLELHLPSYRLEHSTKRKEVKNICYHGMSRIEYLNAIFVFAMQYIFLTPSNPLVYFVLKFFVHVSTQRYVGAVGWSVNAFQKK